MAFEGILLSQPLELGNLSNLLPTPAKLSSNIPFVIYQLKLKAM